jgi:hypothetical protein
MEGYSGTPLARKLGIKDGSVIHAAGAPPEYRELLKPLPPGVRFATTVSASTNIVHLFETERSKLAVALRTLRRKLGSEATLWVSWPKKSCGVPTTITQDVVRELALPLGFVDIKVCAVTEVWSALKLVVRKELR